MKNRRFELWLGSRGVLSFPRYRENLVTNWDSFSC